MNELALFAGAGGGILGGKLLGWKTVCAVEKNHRCQRILLARQNDGSLPTFPIWDDISTFDGRPWRAAFARRMSGVRAPSSPPGRAAPAGAQKLIGYSIRLALFLAGDIG